jgi:hypothetical protein
MEHPLRQVRRQHQPSRADRPGQVLREGARAARQVQHALAATQAQQVDREQPSTGLAPLDGRHYAVPVGRRVAAEHGREYVLRLHSGALSLQAASSARAASTSRASWPKCPTACTPAGIPVLGKGRAITGWQVVLNGRVKTVTSARE